MEALVRRDEAREAGDEGWSTVAGESAARVQRRAGHASYGTTDLYVRQAEELAEGFGDPFPPLPDALVGVSALKRHEPKLGAAGAATTEDAKPCEVVVLDSSFNARQK